MAKVKYGCELRCALAGRPAQRTKSRPARILSKANNRIEGMHGNEEETINEEGTAKGAREAEEPGVGRAQGIQYREPLWRGSRHSPVAGCGGKVARLGRD